MNKQRIQLFNGHVVDSVTDALVWLAKNPTAMEGYRKYKVTVKFVDVPHRTYVSVSDAFRLIDGPQAGDYIDGIVLYREDLINLSWDDRYAVMSFVTEYDKKNLKKLEVHKWTKCALSDVSNGNVDYTNGDPISKLHLTLVLLDAYKQTRKIQDKFEKRVRKFLDL